MISISAKDKWIIRENWPHSLVKLECINSRVLNMDFVFVSLLCNNLKKRNKWSNYPRKVSNMHLAFLPLAVFCQLDYRKSFIFRNCWPLFCFPKVSSYSFWILRKMTQHTFFVASPAWKHTGKNHLCFYFSPCLCFVQEWLLVPAGKTVQSQSCKQKQKHYSGSVKACNFGLFVIIPLSEELFSYA